MLDVDTGASGLALCHTLYPDCVVLDADLPDLDPPTFLTTLRATSPARSIPVVVLSGANDAATAVAALPAGADDYLVKQAVTPQSLRSAVRAAIEASALRQRVREQQRDLEAQDVRFRTSVENLLDCFGIYTAIRDTAGNIVDFRTDYVNDAACRSNQLSREEQLGKGLCALFPAHRSSDLFDEYYRVVESGQPLIKEALIYEDVYGTQLLQRAFDVRVAKLDDGFVATGWDVTEQRRAPEERSQLVMAEQTALALFNNLVMNAPLGIAYIDREFRFQKINEPLAAINGLPVAAHIGRTSREVVPKPADAAEPLFRQVIDTGTALLGLELQGETMAQPGVQHVWRENVYPIYDHDGLVSGVGVVVEDIMAQRQVEAQLAFQARLLDVIEQAVIATELDGTVTYWNRYAERLYGWTSQEACGRYIADLLVSAPVFEQAATIMATLRAGESWAREFQVRRRDGTSFPAWVMDTPILDEDGQVRGVIGVSLDMSERKAAEEERVRLLEQAEVVLAEATRAVQVRDEFLSLAAHELKTPLTVLLGNAQLLQRRTAQMAGLDEPMQRATRVIAEQATRLDKMITTCWTCRV